MQHPGALTTHLLLKLFQTIYKLIAEYINEAWKEIINIQMNIHIFKYVPIIFEPAAAQLKWSVTIVRIIQLNLID